MVQILTAVRRRRIKGCSKHQTAGNSLPRLREKRDTNSGKIGKKVALRRRKDSVSQEDYLKDLEMRKRTTRPSARARRGIESTPPAVTAA